MKEKNYQPSTLYLAKLPFKNEGKCKSFLNKEKLREFVVRRLTLQEVLNKFVQAEGKWPYRVIQIHINTKNASKSNNTPK